MKNKIHNYDFLVIGSGLIGSLTAISLLRHKYRVLVIDKNTHSPRDNRTLAVNANSKDFLIELGLWHNLKNKPEPIKKIEISDTINKSPLIFENTKEEMGNVIINSDLLERARKSLFKKNLLIQGINIDISNIKTNKNIKIKYKNYIFKKIILCLGKNYDDDLNIKKYSFPSLHKSYVGFFDHKISHNQTAYEIFTPEGPLAILPMQKNNTVISTNKNVRSSPRKISLVLDYIRGKKVGVALQDLDFTRRKIAKDVSKTVKSAVANAENNYQMDIDELFIKEAYVGKSIVMKRFRPRAKGRASPIKKPFSRITIILAEKKIIKDKEKKDGPKS